MVMKVLAAYVLLISPFLAVDFASEALRAETAHPGERGQAIQPHWVDQPEIGVIV